GNRALLRHAAVLAVSVAATLVNPYGVQLWRFLASTVGVGREITEWRPLWQQASLSFAALWLATSIMAGTTANPSRLKPFPEAAAALAPQAVRGRLILPFDWGQFAIWHFGPRLRVSIDGRRETVYSDATVRLQAGVASGTPDGLAFVAREQPEYLWLPTDSRATASSWLEPNGYRLDVRTSRSFIARRADLPALTTGHPFLAC